MHDQDAVIRTEGLTRDFGTLRAVDGLTIEVRRGSVFGFLGPNGSGKTTTIRMLLGLIAPTSGRASVMGFDAALQASDIRARSGCLLEHSGIYDRLSAEDNLDLFGRIWKISAADRRARIKEVLQSFSLWDRRSDAAGSWSRGMKQKLAIARVLLHRPALIFLDEPTAGLDPLAAAALRDDLAALARREGVTVFLTTHNLSEAEKLCARVAVIRRGRLLAEGAPEELRVRKSGQRVEVEGRGFDDRVVAALRERPEIGAAEVKDGRLVVDLKNNSPMAPLVPLLVNAGVEIEEIRKERASLEDVFMTLMEEEG
jgi:ABC-2 type transport system ATP-binding protein